MAFAPSYLIRRRPSAAVPDAELDVTPVMNMFIILIPFLVSMAAFTHLAAHEFGLPTDENPGQAQTVADLPLTVAVGQAGIVIAQGDAVLAELPARKGALDLDGLSGTLAGIQVERLVLAVDEVVGVDTVVACLDRCREGGFSDIGLAAGTGVVIEGEGQP